MEDITRQNCEILSAIFHEVDNRKMQPHYSELALRLDDITKNFILHHIGGNLKATSVANFQNVNGSPHPIADLVYEVLSDDTKLIPNGKRMAERLFDLMKPNRAIKQGTIWVVVFKKTDEPQKFLGILKLDHTRSFSYSEETHDGSKVLVIKHKDDALPSEKVQLDKCAFVRERDDNRWSYELRLRDKAQAEGEVANFFQQFLLCEAPRAPKKQTEEFYYAVEEFISNHSAQFPANITSEFVQQSRDAYLSAHVGTQIVPADWVDSIFGPNQTTLRRELKKAIHAKIPDHEFIVDQAWTSKSQKVRKKFSYQGKSVEIRANKLDYENVISSGHFTDPGQNKKYRKLYFDQEDTLLP